MQKVIIAVLNQKGGVGKTTSVINIASYLAKAGKRVVVVDSDPQGNATSGLGVDKSSIEFTLYDGLLRHKTASDVQTITPHENITLIPANAGLAGAEIELATVHGREMALRDFLTGIIADYILIDCPPSLGLLTVNALCAADSVLIPVQTEYYALEGVTQLLQIVKKVQVANPKLSILGVLMTMYDSRTTLSKQVQDELGKHFGKLLFDTVIPRNIRLAEAPSHGLPISDYDKWSKGARSYKALAKEIMTRVEAKK
jgi:chromosome partitioning protein